MKLNRRLIILSSIVLLAFVPFWTAYSAPEQPHFVYIPLAQKSPVILFQDNFEDAAYTYSQWIDPNGACKVTNGNYLCTRNGGGMAGDPLWTDYVFEFEVMGIDVIDKIVNFRWVDGSHAYGFDFRSSPYNDLVLSKATPANNNLILQSVHIQNFNGGWYKFKIVVEGNRIQINVNGNLIMDYVDTNMPVLNGRIALGVMPQPISSSAVYFDNVKVTALK